MPGYDVGRVRRKPWKQRTCLLLSNSNVYFQQYGAQIKGPLCILLREAWQLIPGIIIYGFHLS